MFIDKETGRITRHPPYSYYNCCIYSHKSHGINHKANKTKKHFRKLKQKTQRKNRK